MADEAEEDGDNKARLLSTELVGDFIAGSSTAGNTTRQFKRRGGVALLHDAYACSV